MNFIYAWILSTAAVFGLEMFFLLVGKVLGIFIPFFSTEISITKIKVMIFFSLIAGLLLAIM